MRAWPLAVLLLTLSGCTGTTGPPATPGDGGTCPNWTVGDHSVSRVEDTTLFNGGTPPATVKTSSNTLPIDGHPPADVEGRRVDRYLLKLATTVENGTLEFRAFRNDTGQPLQLYPEGNPAQARAAWTFPSPSGPLRSTASLQVDLGPATAPPSPAVLRLDATFTAAPGRTIGPDAGADFAVEAFALYRAPGCVQK
ncbi:MAG TPA: hypothetical protein VHI93_05715 [Candidatus Thermoplasmatota archaeon]|nr:hypothetical protein [Candidatus Thermoplasmatota archaeon]